jgi:predicted metalloendopeptidase
MLSIRRAAFAASLLVLAACTGVQSDHTAAKPVIGAWGFDTASMDTTVRPGDDFFKYVNGTWIKTNKIPDDKARYGSFDALGDKSEADVRATVEENAKLTHEPGSTGQKVADFYNSFLDTAAIEAKGLDAARADLDAIAGLKTAADVAALMALPGLPGGPIGMGIGLDAKNPDAYVVDIGQDGLGLPDRDYYLRKDKQFADIRAAYKAHIEAMLKLAGYPDAAKAASAILKLETQIAKDSWELAKRRDPNATYNPMTRADLMAFAPGYPWEQAFGAMKLPAGYERFIVAEKDAVQKLAGIFAKTPVSTWKAYMTFHYLDAYAGVLPKAYDDESFAFGSMLSGQKVQRERWKRGISALNRTLGEAVGELYVARYFSPEAKAEMLKLVENLRAAYKARIEALDWMGPETKAQALAKLAAFRVKIGYPDKWRDYSDLEIVAGDALGNMKRSAAYEWRRNLARLEKPTDRDEWFMPPQRVNAYYNPVFNEIVFPAAILQAPFFDLAADPAVNYGAIGAVIGHEMGHGFDDQGAKFDASGHLRNWWTAEDEARFKARTKVLGEQYSAFEPLPGIHVNGDLTMGENIGDLGGISVAHEAYRMSLNGETPEVVDGFTGEQRFFLGYGQVWRAIQRDESLRNQVLSDPHSPPMYRVNGVVPNVDDWYAAFGIAADGKMFIAPEKRVKIW